MKLELFLDALVTPTSLFDANNNKVGTVGKDHSNDDTRRMVYQVAHDMQSPLAAMATIVQCCDELDESKRSILHTASTRIQGIAQNLLEGYRRETGRPTPDRQRQIIRCAPFLHQLVIEKRYEYTQYPNLFAESITPEGRSAVVYACPIQLGRALSNLINNAIDALPDKKLGKVTIGLEWVKSDVKFSIADNGVGMTDSVIRKLSKRIGFTDGKARGHGLGMTQVWEMLDNDKGKMVIQSKPGTGTRIELIFGDVVK